MRFLSAIRRPAPSLGGVREVYRLPAHLELARVALRRRVGVVIQNGKLIRKEDYAATLVAEEDDLITGTADTLDNAVSNEM